MKRIKKWFQKQETYEILCFTCICIVLIMIKFKNIILAGLFSVFILPYFMYLLQNVMEKKQMNRGADIDTYFIAASKQNDIIWKNLSISEMNQNSYLVIQNTGHVDIYEFFIMIKKINGDDFLWRIEEHLLTNKKCVVKIPCDHREICEIVISGDLLTESKTKRFYGKQSSNGKKTIFSSIEYCEKEKDSIIHEHGITNFIPLERVYEREMLKEEKSMERIFQKLDIEEICTEKKVITDSNDIAKASILPEMLEKKL